MYEAYINKQPNFYSIFALNLFLGWTLLGWVAALVWAIKSHDPIRVAAENTPRPSRIIKSKETKQCPFCAEDILIAAIKCKHCGSEI
ncbi:superinfection immunity protein [Shewanella sp. SG41-4]|nr:superinfection immunity protein [Shewanella sp. SG41-4]